MKKLLLTTLLAASFSANAIIIDNDTYTTDTTSGLDWLDVTTSTNQSYNYVSSQFGSGQEYDGWRYASGVELNGLISNWTGDNVISTGYVNQEVDKIDGLVALLGSTLDSSWINIFGKTWDDYYGFVEGAGLDYTFGFIADASGTFRHHLSYLLDDDSNISNIDFSDIYSNNFNNNSRSFSVGSYLVRDTVNDVPAPGPLALMAIGVVAMFRKKFQS